MTNYYCLESGMINTNHTSGKAPNTGGKDMNLYPNDVVEISDDEELEDNVDEYDEDEDYDEKASEEIIETNGKSKVNSYMTESDEDDDEDDENEIDETSLKGDTKSLVKILTNIDKIDDEILPNCLKRKYDNAFDECYDEEEPCDIKSIRNNSDFELTDESSLLDKV